MKCGHCKQEGVTVDHVRSCRDLEAGTNSLQFMSGPPLAESYQDAHPVQPEATRPALEPGYYTVVFDEERDDRITVRIRPHWDEAAAHKGEQVADFLMGSDNTRDYTGFAFVTPRNEVRVWKRFSHNARLRDALAVITQDPEAAGMAYALTSGNCRRCGRTLTVPASIHRGMGPVCAAGGRD